jgi:hypothetical protein
MLINTSLRPVIDMMAPKKIGDNGVLAVEIKSCVGLGAKLEWGLEIFAYCDEAGLSPRLRFSYPNSAANEDHFGQFFAIKGSANAPEPSSFMEISSITELSLGKDYDKVLNVDLAWMLIDKYLGVKEEVMAEVDELSSRYLAGTKVLGVHYRGTDKAEEAPAIPYDRMINNINHYVELYPDTSRVFVASDDANFVEYVSTIYKARPIVYREDFFRSRNGRSVHKLPFIDKYPITRDAIVNCLLLSRCHAVIKTASILSGWSKLFNPSLPVVLINPPYELWFPERELVKQNLFSPI